MNSERWVRIVDPDHIWRDGVDEVWHTANRPQQWFSVEVLGDKLVNRKWSDSPACVTRCRLCDVPPGTKIVDPGPDHELVEPWERDPAGITEYWSISTRSWRLRQYPHHTLTDDDIYRRPIAKPVSKTPQPGEWWFNRKGSRVFIHGINNYGRPVCEYRSGSVSCDHELADWHHEPACTGWDWMPPKPEAEPEPLTLEQRVEAMEQRLKKLEYQVSEWEDSQ